MRANERLAAQHSIDEHINKGLSQALRDKKNRRTKGKRLNLLGEEDAEPQLFSPSRIQAAKERQQVQKELVEQERLDKAQQKMDAQVAREQRDLEKKERQLQRQVNKQFSDERKKIQHLEKEAKRQAKENVIVDRKGQSNTSTTTKLVASNSAPMHGGVEGEVVKVTSRGRAIISPQRFIE